MSRCVIPNAESASITALAAVGVEPIVAASPMPLAPSGLIGVVVVVWCVSKVGKAVRLRQRVVVERAGQQLAVVVVVQLFPERLADALRQPAVDLAGDQHRADDVAAVVDRDVAEQLDLARLREDLDHRDVGAEGEGLVGRFEEVGRLQPGVDVVRQAAAVGGFGDLGQGQRRWSARP